MPYILVKLQVDHGGIVQYEQLSFLLHGHLFLFPRSLIHPCQRLREELKEIALKKCDESVAKFAVCAKEKGMWVVFSCREQNRQSESPTAKNIYHEQVLSDTDSLTARSEPNTVSATELFYPAFRFFGPTVVFLTVLIV